jgi:O-6-methylguanine DNA methyltransferase
MNAGDPHTSGTPAAERLRARGLRVTPQRRAILAAFAGGTTEHLSADEVHARASSSAPELGRGTVYATLAELTELGLLAALGSPEPVRYETNTSDHQHFRCRLCLRLYDTEIDAPGADALVERGFVVERVSVGAEGVCADCTRYEAGLRDGSQRALDPALVTELAPELACVEAASPVGALMIAASPSGLVRLAFEEHADFGGLRERMRSRRGSRAARATLAHAETILAEYFAGDRAPPEYVLDWDVLNSASIPVLRAIGLIARGQVSSYDLLSSDVPAYECGLAVGANPVAIVIPCHRVTRGSEIPDTYTGGADRKRFLRELELDAAA